MKSRRGVSVVLLVSALALSGCASAFPDEDSTSEEAIVALPAVTTPFTATNQSNSALRVTSNVFDPLVFWDHETDEFSPGIATAWEQVSDTEWLLTVRDGVMFHDGTELTAHDVAFTLSEERLWGEDALEPSSLASTFSGVEVEGTNQVRVTTEHPDPAFLQRLASQIGFVVPQALIEEQGIDAFGAHPVGTGPYEVVEVSPGESVRLAANEDYWGPEASYSSVEFVEVAEVSARVSGLATGEYDVVTNLPPDQREVVEGNGQQVVSTEVNNVVSLAFRTAGNDGPVADEKVRQAMAMAIDRQSLVESLWGGEATVTAGFDLPVYSGFHDPSAAPLAQDVEEAGRLLADAGYDGEAITIGYISGYYTNLDRALEVMQQQWADAGIMVELEGVADYTLLDYAVLDVYATSSNVALTDPVSPLWTDWVSPESVYVAQGRGEPSAELTSAARTLATSLDEGERDSAYAEAMQLWDQELPAITLWQPADIHGLAEGTDLVPDPRYWLRLAPTPES